MMNFSKMMFFTIMVVGTMIAVSSNSWINAWMGLEINLLSFIPLMSDSSSMSTTEASLKYFLIQALASCMMLLMAIVSFYKYSFYLMDHQSIYFSKMIILSALLMKSGSAPFHWWFPTVMNGLSWTNSLILMTWQKFAPILLISYVIIEPMICISIVTSAIIGALGGLNQTSLRKLMAYSSINHLSWMLIALKSSEALFLTYFSFYVMLTLNVIFIFLIFDISHVNQIFTKFFKSKNMKFFIFLSMLSLGGLPPFLGFLPKWLVIEVLTNSAQFFNLIILMMMTLITLFYYLRLCYSAFMLNFYEMNHNQAMTSPMNLTIISMMTFSTSMGLMLVSLLYFML